MHHAQGCIQCKHVPICVWFYFIVNLITLCPKFVSRQLCLPALALLAALAPRQCLELWLEIIAISATDQRKWDSDKWGGGGVNTMEEPCGTNWDCEPKEQR